MGILWSKGGEGKGGTEDSALFSPFLPVLTEPCGSQNASFLWEKTHLRPFGRGSAVFSKETRDQAYSFCFFLLTLVNFGEGGTKSRPFPTPWQYKFVKKTKNKNKTKKNPTKSNKKKQKEENKIEKKKKETKDQYSPFCKDFECFVKYWSMCCIL